MQTPSISELESLCAQLVREHAAWRDLLRRQTDAMKALRPDQIELLSAEQEQLLRRIGALEQRRRALALAVARQGRLSGEPTLAQLAAAFPQRATALHALRAQLRDVAAQVQEASRVAARVASAMVGHLGMVVRAVAGGIEAQAVYTRSGSVSPSPRAPARLEAVA